MALYVRNYQQAKTRPDLPLKLGRTVYVSLLASLVSIFDSGQPFSFFHGLSIVFPLTTALFLFYPVAHYPLYCFESSVIAIFQGGSNLLRDNPMFSNLEQS